MLEAMHNCIAHQDYTKHSRISVTEYPDRLEFTSVGSFFEGVPDEYALEGHMPRSYRNPTLIQAMTQLNMIDHLGYGIERMNRSQANRYLPLPDYDLSDPREVKLTIYGARSRRGLHEIAHAGHRAPIRRRARARSGPRRAISSLM